MPTYLRETSGLDLRGLADRLNTPVDIWGGVTSEVMVRREEDRLTEVSLGGRAVPMTHDGLEQFANVLGIPYKYLQRQDAEIQEFLLRRTLNREAANITVRFDDGGISEVYPASQVRLEPRHIVDRVLKVLPEQSPVIEWWADDELRFDVAVPDNFDRGIGGDPQVGDITRGGVRVTQNRKRNLAPEVNTFLYRLVCTNGMEIPRTGTTIDARGSSVEEILAELELAAEHAFSQVEQQIAHFYDMRSQVVEGDVTQAVVRVARERGLPDRTANHLARRVPEQLDPQVLGHPVSMFDITNLITNEANNPELRGRRGPRLQLEQAGGTLVQLEADRCGHCHQVLA